MGKIGMFEFRLYNCYYPYGERNHGKLSHFVADPKTDWGASTILV